ncbi:homoserine dehydrogenase [Actinophytocola sp.]|uniref:homoserine dehydrogenase n=1 Tax=Actinophytocola sp. TaxID=1872138 RepID=UPI003D6BD562
MTATLKVALLGCGTVGGEVARYLDTHADDLAARIGARVELAGIAVRRADLPRPGVPEHLITTDAHELALRPDVDVVIELIGGVDTAGELIRTAFSHGASVVSANKALIAAQGTSLHEAAAAAGADLYYEAAVAGAIPLLRPLCESLAADRITRVFGVVNGTTNFILDKMEVLGACYQEALKEAIQLGYAEADPTADVEGHDAAAKAAILAGIAFTTRVRIEDVHREGITAITSADITAAKALGYSVKFLAVCDRGADDRSVRVRVHPAMIPAGHPLASVRGANNAVLVEADAAGQLMFYGPGAGGAPTSSAVLGDLVAVGRNKLAGVTGFGSANYAGLVLRPMAEVSTRCYVRLEVTDAPDVLASVATVLARHGVPIETSGRSGCSLALVTHQATDGALAAAVAELRGLDHVHEVASLIRIEGTDPAP